MRRLLEHFALSAALGVLMVATGTPVARAATIYQITVSITDLTTPANSTSFVIADGGGGDTNSDPTKITADGTVIGTLSSGSGLTFSGLNAETTSTSSGTSLNAGGAFSLNAGNSDHYLVTVMTTHDTYTLPAGTTATLSQSESGSYTYTNAGNTQKSQSFYSPLNLADDTTGPATPVASIPIPATGGSNESRSTLTESTGINPYVTPYALTNVISFDITGNGSDNNSIIGFHSPTTLTAGVVPEPASVVMFLTGMPLPLVVVGLLRRRRRGVA